MQSHAFELNETGAGGRVEVIGALQETIQVSFSLFSNDFLGKILQRTGHTCGASLAVVYVKHAMPMCCRPHVLKVFWYVVLCRPVLHSYRTDGDNL